MKRKSPITVEKVQFYTYLRSENAEIASIINQFLYDDRRDFAVDEDLMGIAVRLEVNNDRYDRGARRNVKLVLVDLSSRCEIASRIVKINIRKDIFVKDVYVDLPLESIPFTPGHTYKLTVCDMSSSVILNETVFHLFDEKVLGCPMKWYEIISGGIKPTWESGIYKSLKPIDGHDYYIRFTLASKMKSIQPVLPELEMRLYYPDGKLITAQFNEPKYFGYVNFKDGILTADFPFTTSEKYKGIFYAELLCMEWPVAGFVFNTERPDVSGSWVGSEIEPLEEYTSEAAAERLNKFMPYVPEEDETSRRRVGFDVYTQ